jgi:hypothetical protein
MEFGDAESIPRSSTDQPILPRRSENLKAMSCDYLLEAFKSLHKRRIEIEEEACRVHESINSLEKSIQEVNKDLADVRQENQVLRCDMELAETQNKEENERFKRLLTEKEALRISVSQQEQRTIALATGINKMLVESTENIRRSYSTYFQAREGIKEKLMKEDG